MEANNEPPFCGMVSSNLFPISPVVQPASVLIALHQPRSSASEFSSAAPHTKDNHRRPRTQKEDRRPPTRIRANPEGAQRYTNRCATSFSPSSHEGEKFHPDHRRFLSLFLFSFFPLIPKKRNLLRFLSVSESSIRPNCLVPIEMIVVRSRFLITIVSFSSLWPPQTGRSEPRRRHACMRSSAVAKEGAKTRNVIVGWKNS